MKSGSGIILKATQQKGCREVW